MFSLATEARRYPVLRAAALCYAFALAALCAYGGEKGSMDIESKKFRFSVPAGYVDETSYSFRDKEETELVEVNYGRTTPSAPDLAGVMADRLGQVRDAYGSKAQIVPAVSTNMAGLPALQASYRISDENGAHNEWWAIAMLDGENYVHLAYAAASSGERATGIFEHIKKSVARLDSGKVDAASGPDYERYAAGRVAVDVPKALNPPAAYLFVSTNQKVRITVSASEPPKPALKPLSDEVAAEARAGATVSEQTVLEKPAADGSIHAIRYLLTKPGEPQASQQVCLRGRRTFTSGMTIQVNGTMDLPSPVSLERDIVSLLESLVTR
jgi:hypothetical protein